MLRKPFKILYAVRLFLVLRFYGFVYSNTPPDLGSTSTPTTSYYASRRSAKHPPKSLIPRNVKNRQVAVVESINSSGRHSQSSGSSAVFFHGSRITPASAGSAEMFSHHHDDVGNSSLQQSRSWSNQRYAQKRGIFSSEMEMLEFLGETNEFLRRSRQKLTEKNFRAADVSTSNVDRDFLFGTFDSPSGSSSRGSGVRMDFLLENFIDDRLSSFMFTPSLIASNAGGSPSNIDSLGRMSAFSSRQSSHAWTESSEQQHTSSGFHSPPAVRLPVSRQSIFELAEPIGDNSFSSEYAETSQTKAAAFALRDNGKSRMEPKKIQNQLHRFLLEEQLLLDEQLQNRLPKVAKDDQADFGTSVAKLCQSYFQSLSSIGAAYGSSSYAPKQVGLSNENDIKHILEPNPSQIAFTTIQLRNDPSNSLYPDIFMW
jgi:hypothetical protein